MNADFTLDRVTVESVAGVPEPASWALMLTGFGVAGVGLRRQRGYRPGLTAA